MNLLHFKLQILKLKLLQKNNRIQNQICIQIKVKTILICASSHLTHVDPRHQVHHGLLRRSQ